MKFIITVALLILSGVVFADESGLNLQQSTALSSSTNSAATNQGNSQSITFTSPPVTTATINNTISGGTNSTIRQEFGDQVIRNTPSVSGPPLVSSNDTCMGSVSGSANAPGFGISIGKTYTDSNCTMLKNSRELWNMGMKGAAMALMCSDPLNRDALEISGYACPKIKQAKQEPAKQEPAKQEPVKQQAMLVEAP